MFIWMEPWSFAVISLFVHELHAHTRSGTARPPHPCEEILNLYLRAILELAPLAWNVQVDGGALCVHHLGKLCF
jgi:hypothetical protein